MRRGLTAAARPIVVLHVFGQMNRGGAELRTVEIVRHLEPSTVKSLFCVLSGLPGSLDNEIRALDGEIVYCPLGPRFIQRFVAILRHEQVDVVHSHVHLFSGVLLLLARVAGVPVRVIHFRTASDGHPDSPRRRLQRAAMRWAVNANATHILSVSEGAMMHAWRPDWQRDARCQVVPTGLDLMPFRPRAEPAAVRSELGVASDCVLLLHLGRPIASKNRVRAVAVLAELVKRDRSHRYALAFVGGRTPQDDFELMQAADERGVSEMITMTGERHDVPRLLKAADLTLVPSKLEGLPGVVLEAWAAGSPVLGTDLPGLLEISRHARLVRTLSLERPDADWAECALQQLAIDRSPETRDKALAEIAESPFSLHESIERLLEIWRTC